MSAFPLTGPHRASGHASNVFRRSAAHNFGVHATPAVVSRKTVAASSSPTPIPGDGHPLQDTRVSRADRVCRAHRADSEKIGAPIPLDQAGGQSHQRAGWTLLRSERNLCFFLKAVPKRKLRRDPREPNERRVAVPLLGYRPRSKLPRTVDKPVLNGVTSVNESSQIRLRTSGPVSTMKERLDAPVRFPGRPCNLCPHLPVGPATYPTKVGHHADPVCAPGHWCVARLTERRTGV
jgi:hypothetical protein